MSGKKKLGLLVLLAIAVVLLACAWFMRPRETKKIPIKVLILPKFEVESLTGDFPGEAQLYYEAFLDGGEEYEITESGAKLYVKDGAALCVTGMGKVNAAVCTMAALTDERFDFSDAYIMSTGCAGSSEGYGVMGDVYVISAAIDYDLGHRVDSTELTAGSETTWFHDEEFDNASVIFLDPDLTERVYDPVKDIPIKTTERTRAYMAAAFDGAEWAVRDPQVLKGTTVTGDNYWKGEAGHSNALKMIEIYDCPDPYAATEMEDSSIGLVLKHLGMLDRYIIIRDSVNMDVFMLGTTPESLWGAQEHELAADSNVESADIFRTAMENNFVVGNVIIQAILNDEL